MRTPGLRLLDPSVELELDNSYRRPLAAILSKNPHLTRLCWST
jgi:hypothetical protein